MHMNMYPKKIFSVDMVTADETLFLLFGCSEKFKWYVSQRKEDIYILFLITHDKTETVI